LNAPRNYRIGQIVPSSNVTMEAEVPAMLARAAVPPGVTFTFHASRAPMKTVSQEELTAMNGHMARCAGELVDARMDVIASACLVAIMCQGPGYHRETESALAEVCRADAPDTRIVTSAGALIEALHALKAKKIAFITPYMKSLTALVIGYIEAEGIVVKDTVSLEIADNLAVGAQDPMNLVEIVKRLDTTNVDAVVLSACVQMPSLAALDTVQGLLDVPVLSTAAATVFQILRALDLPTVVPHAGDLLSGRYG
jgi:maleate isomerase